MILPLTVETWIVETDEMETSKVIDHADHADRVWLGKHSHWAFRNGRGIVCRPVTK